MNPDYEYMNFTKPSMDVITERDHFIFGVFLWGMMVGMLTLATCCWGNPIDSKINELTTENDELQSTVEEIISDNNDLEEENGRLTADAVANERLIDELKKEVLKLTNTVSQLRTNNAKLSAKNIRDTVTIDSIQDTLRRVLETGHSSESHSELRKRFRSDTDL